MKWLESDGDECILIPDLYAQAWSNEDDVCTWSINDGSESWLVWGGGDDMTLEQCKANAEDCLAGLIAKRDKPVDTNGICLKWDELSQQVIGVLRAEILRLRSQKWR